MPSQFELHRAAWIDCERCELCKRRKSVVLARGVVPAEVLMLGEAPGQSEDVLGTPFEGPAGQLLDDIILQAVPGHVEIGEDGNKENWIIDVRIAFTNLVACIPIGEGGVKTAEPPKESIEACAPRLREFVAICKPKLIVCVGALAETWAPRLLDPAIGNMRKQYERSETGLDRGIVNGIRVVAIQHPAAILRSNVAMRGLAVQRAVVILENAMEEIQ